jgi:hypothetical protein
MAIVLPTPTGDDQAWKRQVAEVLAELDARIEAAASQVGKRE